MEEQSNVQAITGSSRKTGGTWRGNWRTERIFLASKMCAGCGKEFHPWIKRREDGTIASAMQESQWEKQRYCSVGCAKKHSPTALDANARDKIKRRLKEIRHKPIQRCGNGCLLPLPQLALLHALGDGWEAEVVVKTGAGHLNGIYPNAYKLDIANTKKKIAIEVDGGSHTEIGRQEQDQKKTHFLTGAGWRVYRVSNERALFLYSTFKSVDTLLTLLME